MNAVRSSLNLGLDTCTCIFSGLPQYVPGILVACNIRRISVHVSTVTCAADSCIASRVSVPAVYINVLVSKIAAHILQTR
jgi:hypothetical protein